MSLYYRNAPTVAAGDAITSTQLRQLADAINDRAKHGPGDPAQRFMLWWLNGFRQLRNGDESGFLLPPQAEFFQIYQHIDRNNTTLQYPLASPGEAEGANLANVMNQFIFGSSWMDSEDIRTEGVPLWLGLSAPTTPEEFWTLGKFQRGALNAATGVGNTPALSTAVEAFYIQTSITSLHGKGFGGFFPTPTVLAENCGVSVSGGKNVRSYEIKFTALQADVTTSGYHGTVSTNGDGMPTVTYGGSCPIDTEDTVEGHVWGIFRGPTAFFVFVNPGFIDVFPTANWIEGPYTGNSQLFRYDGGQVSRAIWAYVTDRFRGTAAQRNPDTYNIEEIGFDFQWVSERQYTLAPARGVENGDSIQAIYPTASATGSAIAEGALLTWLQTGTTSYHRFEYYVFAGMFVKATKLAEACAVEIIDEEGAVIQTVTLTPDENGDASDVVWFTTASDAESIQARMKTRARFTGSDGTLTIEIAELFDYKPQFWDLYLVLRLMSTEGGDDADLDSIDGESAEPFAKELSDTFIRWGTIYNAGAAGVRTIRDAINTNPVYDSFRKLSREMVKILSRESFVSYAVEDGKSVLRLKRYPNGLRDDGVDTMYAMAPSTSPPEEIIEGEEYVVRALSGFVTYMGANYSHGQRFIGSAGEATYSTTGDALPFEYDGIKATARKKGFTNEWVGFMATHAEHPSESSLWKPAAYADYFPFQDRCHFYSFPSNVPQELYRHINPNYVVNVAERADGTGWNLINEGMLIGDLLMSPESVTGYRYVLSANTNGISEDFCRSCRIYEPPREVESCIVEPDMVSGGINDVVKITFKTRLHYDEANAPASVNPDVSTWSSGELDDLRNVETYRTDDNALREYARYLYDGTHGSWKEGDEGAPGFSQSVPDNPFGSIMPHFYFCKLVPKPYEDGNNRRDAHDSRMTIDALRHAEIWLKAMCEGFVDGFTEGTTVCADPGVNKPYDYTFENLCFAAFGGSSIGAFGLSVRPDEPKGHGPMPNTVAYADVFNRLSSAVNLLYLVRFELPLMAQTRLVEKTGEAGHGSGCVEGTGPQLYQFSGCPPATTTTTTSAWGDGILGSIIGGAGFTTGDFCTDDGQFRIAHSSIVAEIRFTTDATRPEYQHAILPEYMALLEQGSIHLFGEVSLTRETPYRTAVTPPDGENCNGATPFITGWHYEIKSEVFNLGCTELTQFSLDTGNSPCGDFFFGADPVGCGNGSAVMFNVSNVSSTSNPVLRIPTVDP
jgi:hypothetical protein